MPQDIIVNGILWNGVASIDVLNEDGTSVRYYSHGAYYTPSVDEEGNLKWTPVREDMPEVPIENIRGPQGVGGIKKIIDFSISPKVWTENSENEAEYKYCYNLADADITKDDIPFIVLSEECLSYACIAGLCPTVETFEGYAKFESVEKPTTEIKGTCFLMAKAIEPQQIKEAVREYLNENPIPGGGGGTGAGLPVGGKTGQYLRKASDADGDVYWGDIDIPSEYGLVTYDNTQTLTVS